MSSLLPSHRTDPPPRASLANGPPNRSPSTVGPNSPEGDQRDTWIIKKSRTTNGSGPAQPQPCVRLARRARRAPSGSGRRAPGDAGRRPPRPPSWGGAPRGDPPGHPHQHPGLPPRAARPPARGGGEGNVGIGVSPSRKCLLHHAKKGDHKSSGARSQPNHCPSGQCQHCNLFPAGQRAPSPPEPQRTPGPRAAPIGAGVPIPCPFGPWVGSN